MSRRVGNVKYQKRRKSKLQSLLPVIIVGVVAVIIVVGLIILSQHNTTITRTSVANQTSLGVETAPVKVEEFGDYQCPACGSFFAQMEPALVSNYINPGKVYFTFTPFSFIGPESFTAAQAAYCAMDQNKFWEYHDSIYNNQRGENQGGFNNTILVGFAQKLGLNMDTFNTCFADGNGKYAQLVNDNVAYGNTKNIQQTPSFLVDGKLVYMDTLLATIDAELKAKGQ